MDEPKTRDEFLQYSSEMTLDPDTPSKHLVLSEGNRKATKTGKNQSHPPHPRRFPYWTMVLSTQTLTGRHYWEVEYEGRVHVGVAYDSIGRDNANENSLGRGPQSWALFCSHKGYEFWHNGNKTPTPGPHSSRVGVYLDRDAGILSFYSVSHTMTLQHRVQTTFSTGPLHAALWFYWNNGDHAEIFTRDVKSAEWGLTGVDGIKTREDLLQYSSPLTLDPDTPSNFVVLSDGNTKATKTGKKQSYPSHPRRFQHWSMVLSTQSMTGRHYWEVEFDGRVHIGVAYDRIGRDSQNVNSLGRGPQSWALFSSSKGYELWHDGNKSPVTGPHSHRVGVYLDHSAGILAFYSVSHSLALLHKVQTTFTEPLHAALWFYWDNGDHAQIF